MGGMESDLHQGRYLRVIMDNEPKEAAWNRGAGSDLGQECIQFRGESHEFSGRGEKEGGGSLHPLRVRPWLPR